MRTIETTLYSFDELSDDAKQTAIQAYRNRGIFFAEWWEAIYDDAENVYLKIESFECGRRWEISLKPMRNKCWNDVAEKILSEHGKKCGTYKAAEQYLKEYAAIAAKEETEDYYDASSALSEIDDDFRQQLGEEYLIMLRNEEEYISSDEAIAETLEANGYEYDEDGERA